MTKGIVYCLTISLMIFPLIFPGSIKSWIKPLKSFKYDQISFYHVHWNIIITQSLWKGTELIFEFKKVQVLLIQ